MDILSGAGGKGRVLFRIYPGKPYGVVCAGAAYRGDHQQFMPPAQVRELTIKNRRYILRRPVVEITDENVAVLQFLDCLKDLEKCAEEEPEVCGRILTGYAREHALTKAAMDRFLANYPLRIYKAIYEAGVEYEPVRIPYKSVKYGIVFRNLL